MVSIRIITEEANSPEQKAQNNIFLTAEENSKNASAEIITNAIAANIARTISIFPNAVKRKSFRPASDILPMNPWYVSSKLLRLILKMSLIAG
jgi:hypothetical protein